MERATIEKIYERLGTFSLDSPRDPAALGPEFLREQISLCRNYLNETAHYFQDALVEESYLAMQLDSEEASYQIRSNELLASDPRVTSRPNIADRQAVIETILMEERRSIINLQSHLRSLGHVKAVIVHRKKELDSTMSSLRLQRSLLNDQLRTGAFYGDESERSRGQADPVDALDGNSLEALLAASEAELEAEHGATQAAELSSEPSLKDPADFLDGADLEAIVSGTPVAAAVEEIATESASTDQPVPEIAAELHAEIEIALDDADELSMAIDRFLEEPSDDIESILASI